MNFRDNVLIQAMVAVAVIGVALIFYNQHRLNSQIVEKQKITSLIEKIGNNLRVKAMSYPDWEATKHAPANSSLACLRLNTDCTGQGGDIVLMDREGKEWSSAPGTKRGFDREGKPCANFGSGECLVAVGMKWEPVCPPSGGCKNPQVRLLPNFQYAGVQVLGGLSMERFNADFVVGGASAAGGGGVSSAQGLCPAGQFVTAVANGVVQCAAPANLAACSGVAPDCSKLECRFGPAMLACAGQQWLCVCAR